MFDLKLELAFIKCFFCFFFPPLTLCEHLSFFFFFRYTALMPLATKQRGAPSLSFSDFSGLTLDFTDDPVSITRSSLTQRSCRNDSHHRTRDSSSAGGTQTQPTQAWVPVTPRGAPTCLAPNSGIRNADAHGGVSTVVCLDESMDMFDLAFAEEMRLRQQQQHHHHQHPQQHPQQSGQRRYHHHIHQQVSPVQADSFVIAAATVGEDRKSNTPLRRYTIDKDERRCREKLDVPFLCNQEVRQSRSRVSKGCQVSSPLLVAVPSDSTLMSHAGSTAAQLRRDSQVQHLQRLLRETRNLHEALQQQLQELQLQGEKERQSRGSEWRLHIV